MEQSLFAKSGFQGFLFAGGVITVIAAKTNGSDDPELNRVIVDRIVYVAIAALVTFVVALALKAFKPGAFTQTTPPHVVDLWPSADFMKDARGLMLLGLVIYVGYHFLDFTVVAPGDVDRILTIRLVVATLIAGLCAWSFFPYFRAHYTVIMTVATSIAGAGIGAMMFVAGPGVHFYYQGFIQVIAFAAFAFRLPPRALACQCAFILATYAGVLLHQHWVPGSGLDVDSEMAGILTNNVVSLVTFVVLALATSFSLARRRPTA